MSVYLLSTMTGAVAYCFYDKGPDGGLPLEKKRIYLHGGAHLPSLSTPFGAQGKDDQGTPMWTPSGVVTAVTDEAYAELLNHDLFKKHVDGGFVRVVDAAAADSHKVVEKAVREMKDKDNSAQLTPENAKAKLGKNSPKVRSGEEDTDAPKKRIKD